MKITRLNQILQDGEILKGSWELSPLHELRYRGEGRAEEIHFRGSLVAAEPGALIVSVTEKQEDQKIVTSILRLAGEWKVNLKNQLTFEVEKGSGNKDTLVFRGGWSVNRRHEIVYSYQEESLKKKTKLTRELVLKGFWDITEKDRLTYYLGGDESAALRFRGTWQTRSILAKKGEIRYQVGTEISGKRKLQTISLFGVWKVSHDLVVNFQIQYRDLKHSLVFGGEYNLAPGRQVAVNLRSVQGAPLGVRVLFSQKMMGGSGELLLRLQKDSEETSVEAGARLKW